jgi:LysR family transcriptional activator of nhaA
MKTWLNYHHLHYFWVTARTGSVTGASEELHLSQPAISAQLRTLEAALGHQLFERAGRGIRLTEMGRAVFDYADEIFTLGRELIDTLNQQQPDRPLRLRVGVADVIPKLVAEILLRPATELDGPLHLVCTEGKAEDLEGELGRFGLDVVLTDSPLSPRVRVKAYSHLLGSCGVTLFSRGDVSRRYRKGFPRSLDGAPMLLPGEGTVLRRQLESWFDRQGVRPVVVGEFEDSALMKVFGQRGLGLFPVPEFIADEVSRHYRVRPVAPLEGVEERFYAITVERRIRHPGVLAICDTAREHLGRTGAEPPAS